MTGETKVDEVRIRRKAARQGLRLNKSRKRDPRALGYGLWTLSKEHPDASPPSPDKFKSLREVEAYLTGSA